MINSRSNSFLSSIFWRIFKYFSLIYMEKKRGMVSFLEQRMIKKKGYV